MATLFKVYDIKQRSCSVVDFKTICSYYPDISLEILNESYISILSIYDKGEKIAVINRIKEDNDD